MQKIVSLSNLQINQELIQQISLPEIEFLYQHTKIGWLNSHVSGLTVWIFCWRFLVDMDKKKWLIVFGIEVFVLLFGISLMVTFVDPYFHCHKPISSMFYRLDNQRSQNDGIIKQFDFDSIIMGTSMCENFKASEFDALFQAQSIKICFSGGSYKEINDNLNRALNSGREIKYVLRCIDYMKLIEDKDHMPSNLGEHPTYLYDIPMEENGGIIKVLAWRLEGKWIQ